jgi:hypothetical protein
MLRRVQTAPRCRATLPALPSLCVIALAALAGCGGGGGGGNGGGGGTSVTIAGKAQYESPPPVANCNGLDFNSIRLMPIRQATVQLLDSATDAVLDEP